MTRGHWSEAERSRLRRLYTRVPIREIAKRLRRSYETVRSAIGHGSWKGKRARVRK